jgi:hypothetical protein
VTNNRNGVLVVVRVCHATAAKGEGWRRATREDWVAGLGETTTKPELVEQVALCSKGDSRVIVWIMSLR